MVTNVDLSMMSQPLNLNDKDKEVAAQTRRLKIPLAGALCDLPKQMIQPLMTGPGTRMKLKNSNVFAQKMQS